MPSSHMLHFNIWGCAIPARICRWCTMCETECHHCTTHRLLVVYMVIIVMFLRCWCKACNVLAASSASFPLPACISCVCREHWAPAMLIVHHNPTMEYMCCPFWASSLLCAWRNKTKPSCPPIMSIHQHAYNGNRYLHPWPFKTSLLNARTSNINKTAWH